MKKEKEIKLYGYYGTSYMFGADRQVYFETRHTKEELENDFELWCNLVEAAIIEEINVQSYIEEA